MVAVAVLAQDRPFPDGPPPFGPGPGGGGGFGGPPNREEVKLVSKFDKNGDKILDSAERKAALESLQKERSGEGGRRGPGPRGPRPPMNYDEEPATPGPKMSPSDVKTYADEPLYSLKVVRTIFIEFPDANWEKEMAAFKNTDVELSAKVVVDGKTFNNVGVHFRGASSFDMVPEGRKRSLNLTFDFVDKDQKLLGYRSLELNNSHEDPTMLRAVLYSHIARGYIPAPKANFMRVVINGEFWGIYCNSQPFNKDFVDDFFRTSQGVRWKTPGSPRGQATLKYLGDDPAKYKGIYELKSKEDPKAWADLINLCKVLTETPADKLESALSPILNVDGALKFLALENALVNNDGYWVRTSDYSLYQDVTGKFHVLPHDYNETFARPGGPGMRMQTGDLDPLLAVNDSNKPLLSSLLAVPAWRDRYLGYVKQIATTWLDWRNLGPLATDLQNLIAADVKIDTRKLDSTEAFFKALNEDIPGRGFGPMGRGTIGLKNFASQRHAYLAK